jgi:UDPglucose--hexose-1-phosphate uridylyltransferase
MSEIRLDRFNNKYVLIAPERLHRPNLNLAHKKENSMSICPFCEGNEDLTPSEIYAIRTNEANAIGWQTRVVPNLYKAVQIELADKSKRDGMFESIPGVGAHEILIDSTCHDCEMHNLEVGMVENWLRSMIIRIEDLQKDHRLVHLSLFKNHGINAGATQEHPHTQILSLPIMPKEELEFLERNMSYYKSHGRGILEDLIHNEMTAKKRVVDIFGSFVAFCPYASAYPFEVMIVPTKNIKSLNNCSRKEVLELATLIKRVFIALKKQLGHFDYNLYFKLPPLNTNFENESYIPYLQNNYRFSMSITPRIYTLGGFEISTSMAINSVMPEDCAKLLRGD